VIRSRFGVQEMGYVTPTPIQAQAIPVVLKGGDVIGSAQPARARPRRSRCRSFSGSVRTGSCDV